MENNNINESSKIIADYLGWKYFPFNNLQGLPKAGWYKVKSAAPDVLKHKVISSLNGESTVREIEVDLNFLKYNNKNGWILNGGNYYKYVCRHHADLRFYNSMDELLRVIEKLEKEDLSDYHYKWECVDGEIRNNFVKLSFVLYDKRCYSEIELDLDPAIEIAKGNDEHLTWIQNTFNCVVDTINYVNKIRNN